MDVTTAMVISDDPQADGRRRVVYEYDTGTGFTWRTDALIGAGVDAQTDADSRIPAFEAEWRQREREDAWALGRDGGDPDLPTWHFNTLAEIRKFYFRRLFNAMRDDGGADVARAAICATCRPYLNKHNASVTSGFIDDPAWTVAVTNGARSNISALGVNYDQVDHGESELDFNF